MDYGYLDEGELVAPVPMCSRFKDIGAWHTLTDEDRAKHGWYRCEKIETSYNSMSQYRGQTVITLRDGIIYCETPIHNKSIDLIKQDLLKELLELVDAKKKEKTQFLSYYFFLEELDELFYTQQLNKSEFVFYNYRSSVIKISSSELSCLIQQLFNKKNKLLGFQYHIEQLLNQMNSVDELVNLNMQNILASFLES